MPGDILQNVRAKYPQYKDMNDSTLAASLLKKYPQYQDALSKYVQPQQEPSQFVPAHTPTNQQTLGQQNRQMFGEPGQLINQGFGEFLKGAPEKGIPDLISGAIRTPFSGFGVVSNTLKSFNNPVTTGIAKAVDLPGQIINAGVNATQSFSDLLGRAIEDVGGKPVKEWSQRHANPKLNGAMRDVLSIELPLAVPEAMRYGSEAAKKIQESHAESQLEKAGQETKRVAGPGRKELNYDQANTIWQRYMNRALKNDPNAIDRSSPETAMRQTTDLTNEQMHGLWDNLDKANLQFGDAKIVNGDAVKADAVANAASNQYAKVLKPDQIAAVKSFVGNLPSKMSFLEAAEFIKGLNADLDGFYGKTSTEQAVIENKYGGVAGLKSVRDALAKEYFGKLESFGQRGIPKARNDYGALSQMHTALERKIIKSEQPVDPKFLHRGAAAFAGEVAGGLFGGPLGATTGMVAGYGLQHLLENRYAPNATILRALGRIAKYGSEPADIPAYNPNIRGYLSQGTTQLPSQFPDETGGPMGVRSGLGGSGMAPGLLPERGGPPASTPPPSGSFYEPGQKFVEGGTQPRGTAVYHDVINIPDELRTYAGVKSLREQLVGMGVPRKEVYQMQLPELWREYQKKNSGEAETPTVPKRRTITKRK